MDVAFPGREDAGRHAEARGGGRVAWTIRLEKGSGVDAPVTNAAICTKSPSGL